MAARYFREQDVAQLITIEDALAAVTEAHRLHAAGEAIDLPRERTRMPGCFVHLLQGAIPGWGIAGHKVYTSTREATRFWVHLFSARTGEALAVIEANLLGALRTAAAAALAARYLARAEASVVALFGAGLQAEWQLRVLAHTRPLREVRIVARRFERAQDLANRLEKELNLCCIPVAREALEQALAGAQLIITATTAAKPLFAAELIEAGAHINAIGSNSLLRQEIPEELILKADPVVVDSRDVALKESGNLLPLLEKGRTYPRCWIELGELVAGIKRGRASSEAITLFASHGMAIQDLALARLVYERALATHLGELLPY